MFLGRAFVGRADELAGLQALYAQAAAGRPVLAVVEGPPGIGKTALLRRFLAGLPGGVLMASGAEHEASLPYGVLARLLGHPVHTDPPTAGAQLLEPLGELQRRGRPVVLVVDDAHWADAPSLHALAFALRRLRADQVLCLVAVRDLGDGRLPDGLHRLLTDDTAVHLRLDGLAPADLVALSAGLLPEPLPETAAARLRAHTGGNPLHCRALLEEVPAHVLRSTGTPLPAPQTYTRLVLDRLARCGPPARALVEAAAVLGSPCALTRAAALAALDDPLPALAEPLDHGLLQETPGPGTCHIAFTHPLVRAAVYHRLGPVRRTALHTRAADAEDDPHTRLHHRVLAAHGPDDRLAAQLADRARRRGALGRWVETAPLLRHAADLTSRPADRGRLACEAVEALLLDGRREEAATVVAALPEDTDTAVRYCARGHLALVSGHIEQARTLLDEAWRLRTPGADPGLETRIAEQYVMVHMMSGRAGQSRTWARTALDGAARAGGTLRFVHLAALGQLGAYDEASALTKPLPDASLVGLPDIDLLLGRGTLHLYTDRLRPARADFERAVDLARTGPVPLRVIALTLLAKTEFLYGDWDLAEAHWETASSVAADLGQGWIAPVVHAEAALPPAARGAHDRAAAHLRLAHANPVVRESRMLEIFVTYGLAHLDHLRGDHTAALALLRPLLAHDDLDFTGETANVPWRDLLCDCLVAAGELDEADRLLTALEERAARRARASTLAAVQHTRGALYTARREPKRARDAYAEALDRYTRLDLPFPRARTELDFGAFLRRTGRTAPALDLLRAARDRFAALGAVPFLRDCDRELAACGAAPASTSPSWIRERLTPQEHAVTRLAATGLTNRAIARELVLSAKTVEYHLSHAYAKLGVRSRVELAARLGGVSPGGSGSRD
ncbi:AAA family ATPase [Streptomyces sp. YKOK-I1]